MGRTKKEDSSSSATKGVDAKSKAIEKAKLRQTRERAQKSYREHSESEESEKEIPLKEEEVKFSDEEVSVSESGSDWAGESSGSEYGKKKGKGKKGKVVGKGRGKKPTASPKVKGRGRPAVKGKAKPKASPASSRNGNRKAAAKRYRDDSESESEAASSGSEYGKRAKPSPKKTPTKAAATPSARGGRGRPKAAAKSYKEISEEDDFSEEEVPKKPATKKFKKEESEEEMHKSDESGSEPESKPTKVTPKPKSRAAPAKPAKNGDEDGVDDKKPVEKKKGKESEESGSAGSESEEEKVKPKEKPVEKSETKNGEGKAKAKKDEEEDEEEEDDISEEEVKEKERKSDSPAPALKNKADTDFESIKFECPKKTAKGDDWNFKISCWNVGGIKSWVKKDGLDYLKRESPDVMCLQEIRCTDKTKPPELKTISGYPHTYWDFAEQAGQHGVAILSKTEPKKVINGLPIEDSDSDEDKKNKEKFNQEGRLLTAEYEDFHLINAYVPNGGRGVQSEKHPKGYPPKVASGERQDFDKLLRAYIKNLDEKKPVILTGDLNVSHAEIDLANPKTNNATAGFTKEEREGMTQLLEETKLFDSFRELYPDTKGAYTFWSYMHNSRQRNIGWRLDYFLLSEKLRESLCENLMRTEVYGSDHCPLVLFIKV